MCLPWDWFQFTNEHSHHHRGPDHAGHGSLDGIVAVKTRVLLLTVLCLGLGQLSAQPGANLLAQDVEANHEDY